MSSGRTVVTKELPERVTQSHVAELTRVLGPLVRTDWPCVVLDCSSVRELDRAGVEMLLWCVEEAAKRNGDLKLACVPPPVAIVLELTKADRLFEMFENVSDAIVSFYRFPTEAFRDAEIRYVSGSNTQQ